MLSRRSPWGCASQPIQAPTQAGIFWETRSKVSLLQSCRDACPRSHCRKSALELETALLPALLWFRNWHANKNRTNRAPGGPVLVAAPSDFTRLSIPCSKAWLRASVPAELVQGLHIFRLLYQSSLIPTLLFSNDKGTVFRSLFSMKERAGDMGLSEINSLCLYCQVIILFCTL